MPAPGFGADDREKVRRGAVLSVAGAVLSASQGITLLVARHLYGGVTFGLFVIAYSVIELGSRFLLGGFSDAAVYFGARDLAVPPGETDAARRYREARLYDGLAACLAAPLLLSVLAAAVIVLGAGPAVAIVWPEQDPLVARYLEAMALVLPLSVAVRLPVEAIKAHLRVEWAVAVADTLLPALTLSLVVVLHAADAGPMGLAWALVGAHVIALPVAWTGYARHFDARRTAASVRRCLRQGEVFRFALPQSANLVVSMALVRVDVIMLARWVPANLVGIYALVGELARSIRAAQTSFAQVLAPVVARYRQADNRQGIEEALAHVASGAVRLGVPLGCAVLLVYPHVVLAPGARWPHAWAFPLLLALGPLANCMVGFAANTLLMTGHARVLFANAAATLALNIALNVILIPRFGLVGAATATFASALVIYGLQVTQLWRREHIRYPLGLAAVPVAVLPVIAAGLMQSQSLDAWLPEGFALRSLVQIGVVGSLLAPLYFRSGSR